MKKRNDQLKKDGGLKGELEEVCQEKKKKTETQKPDFSGADSDNFSYDLFSHINSGVAVYKVIEGGKDFVFKDFNAAAERIDHKSREEVVGRKLTDVYPGIKKMKLLETLQRVWKTGKPESHPIALYKDDNLTGWRENYIYKLPSGEIVAIFNDLTQTKKAEARERWLASFPEINPLFILEIDEKLNILYMNPSVQKQFPGIEMNSASQPFLSGVIDAIKTLKKEKKKDINIEVKVGEHWYSQVVCTVQNSNGFRIYAYETTEKRKAELVQSVLLEIIQAAVATQDFASFFNLVKESIAKIVYADNFNVFLFNNKNTDYSNVYSSNKYDSAYIISQIKEYLLEERFQEKRSSFFTPEMLKSIKGSVGKQNNLIPPISGICIPLKTSNHIIGICTLLDYERTDRFQSSDLQSFDLIAGQIAEIIQRKQAQFSLLKHNRMLQMLSETNHALIHIDNEKELLSTVCGIIIDKGQYRMAWIGYAGQNIEKSVIPVAQKGFEEGYLDSANVSWADTKYGQSPIGTAIRTNKITISRDIANDPKFIPWKKAAAKRKYRSSIAIPLSISGKVIGSLNIYAEKVDAFDDEEVKLLSEMAGDLSYGIASLRTREEKKLTEETLRESEEKFKFVFENSVEGKSLTSVSGEIHVNKAFCEMLGYSPEELQKKKWQDITHPDDIENTEKELNTLLSGKKKKIRFLKRYIKKDGSIVWADILTSLRWDKDHNPMYFITAIIDITKQVKIQQKLKESNDFQQSLFETTSLATSVLEKDMTISRMNHAFELLTGYSKKEVEGKRKWTEFVDPEYLDMMMKYHDQRRIDPEKIPKQYEFCLLTKDKTSRDILLTVDLVPGTQKSIASLFDITDRKQNEKAIREANTIINRSPAVAFLWRKEPGWPVEFVSENVIKLFGYSAEDFIKGKITYRELIHQDDVKRVDEEVKSISHKLGLNSFSHQPYRIVTKNNEIKWINDITFIRRNGEGKITHYEGIVFDITERRIVEEKLEISQNNYRSVVDFAPLIINNFLPNGKITFVNKAYCDFFGKEIPKVLGTNFFSMISSQDRESMKKSLAACSKESPVIVIENRVNKQGKLYWIRWTDCAFFDENGKIAYYQSYGQDIHDQRHIEQLLQALNRATISMETALTVNDIFNAVASELQKLDTTCMFLPMDDKQETLFTKYLYYDSKLLNKAEQLVGLQHEKYSFPIKRVKPYDEAIRNKKVTFIKNTEPLFYQILPSSTKIFAKQIIRFLNASKSIIAPLVVEGKTIGIFSVQSDFLTENDVPIFTAFNDQLAGAWKRVELLQDLKKTIDGTILTIASTVEMRDPYTAGHQTRVANLAAAIAREMNLSHDQIESIHMAGIIHDLGKINVPAEILSKPGKISELEFEIIKTHPQIGYDLLKKIEFPWPIAQIVLQHHEKMDGSGYPHGLKGEEIMIEARILCVADIVEAMSSHRPYRPSMGIDAALAQIKKDRGILLDPQVVDVCLNLFANGYQFEDKK